MDVSSLQYVLRMAIRGTMKNILGSKISETSMGLLESVVVRHARDLLDKGVIFFMYNYEISIPLANLLLSRITYLCGTTRANSKHLPTSVKWKKLKRGEMDSAVR